MKIVKIGSPNFQEVAQKEIKLSDFLQAIG